MLKYRICICIHTYSYMYMYVHDPEPEMEPEPEPKPEPEPYSDNMSEPEPEPSSNFPVPQPCRKLQQKVLTGRKGESTIATQERGKTQMILATLKVLAGAEEKSYVAFRP